MLACAGVTRPAQPFFAALLQIIFPHRPVVIVTGDLKTQESLQQDLETWLALLKVQDSKSKAGEVVGPPSSPLFYPAWEIFPQEGKLPHADVISDRLQTLVALAEESKVQSPKSRIVPGSLYLCNGV